MKYLIAIVLLLTLVFTYITCMEQDKYITVKVNDCKKLQDLIDTQEEPTNYVLPSDCQLENEQLPIIVNKSDTIIDGSGVKVSGGNPTEVPRYAFILTKKNIILANMTIEDFSTPVQVRTGATSFLYNVNLQGTFESALVVGNSEEPLQPPESIETPNEQATPELLGLFSLPIKSAYADTSTCIAVGQALDSGNDMTIEAEHTTEVCNGGISGSGDGTGIEVNGGTLQIGTTFTIRDVNRGIFMSASGGNISVADGTTSITNSIQYGLGINRDTIEFGTGSKIVVSHNFIEPPLAPYPVCIKDRDDSLAEDIRGHATNGHLKEGSGTEDLETARIYACQSCTNPEANQCNPLTL